MQSVSQDRLQQSLEWKIKITSKEENKQKKQKIIHTLHETNRILVPQTAVQRAAGS